MARRASTSASRVLGRPENVVARPHGVTRIRRGRLAALAVVTIGALVVGGLAGRTTAADGAASGPGRSPSGLTGAAVVGQPVPGADGSSLHASRAGLGATNPNGTSPRTTPEQGQAPGTTLDNAPDTGAIAGVNAADENRLPGAAKWRVTKSPRGTLIQGFADAVSVETGASFGVHVSASAKKYRVEVLRTGWYGGRLARTVTTLGPFVGGLQAESVRDAGTRMVSAPWKRSFTVDTTGWAAGTYLLKLIGSDGARSYVPVTVRAGSSEGALLLVNSVLTWQAYNSWGGASTYKTTTPAPGDEDGFDERSVAASFDRPYDRDFGAANYITTELPAVAAAERIGLRLNYATDLDLALHPEVLDGAVGVAFLGHSEYWSRDMRAVATAARDRGTNLAFLGANHVHRRIRIADTALGKGRMFYNYKLGEADPVKTRDTTADWPKPPFAEPQASLIGGQFRCARGRADLVVTDPDAWLFKGLGVQAGTRLKNVVGAEFDRVVLPVPTPRPLQVLSHSPVLCRDVQPEWADVTYYTTPSGAGVFAAGTLDWIPSMNSRDPLTAVVMTQATERVLKLMATPLAGRVQAAQDNVADFYAADGTPLG